MLISVSCDEWFYIHLFVFIFFFFFFKQKTAYEMRISDWSSDVCSSDLHRLAARFGVHDDLGQDIMGDVLAALGIDDAEIAALAHHRAQILERDVAAAFGVVETTVRIFLDDEIGRASCRERVCQYV